eukprot:TRINITY_DN63144_c0_g1_i1.p1 TRINITY_DN63144_c0_g1~~TRINITY_DN63144_c0_g1_i1.p1  ORF type:complete len:381 (+),score=26.86 TRINITY_DN63144_c0_g1_i1:52-1143(+)
MSFRLVRSLVVYAFCLYPLHTFAEEETAVIVDASPALGAWFGLDVDDDLAIAFLAGVRRVRLLGATAAFGNTLSQTSCRRLHLLLDELRLDTLPRACGPAGGMLETVTSALFVANAGSVENDAADLFVRLTQTFRADPSNTQRLVWLSLGAMTNVAAALRQLRQSSEGSTALHLPDEIVVLGSRLDGGWELNVWADPGAAYDVLVKAPTFVNVTLVPRDAMQDAVIGMRALDQLRSDCADGWLVPYIGALKRYAWIAGHFQRGGQAKPSAVHGFRPWDVGAAAAVAYPDQLFSQSSCRTVELEGSVTQLGAEGTPCEHAARSGNGVRVLSQLAVPQFLAVMVDGLCANKLASVPVERGNRSDL